MKKMLALLMIAGMSLSSSAFAISIDELPETPAEWPTAIEVTVPATLSVKNSTGTAWSSRAGVEVGSTGSFDFEAKLDMENVRKAYTKLYDTAEKYGISQGWDPSSIEILLMGEKASVTGEFEVVINKPEGITVPDSIMTASNMAGFEFADGIGDVKEVYTEVSRDYNSDGDVVIKIKVKDGMAIRNFIEINDDGEVVKDDDKIVLNNKLGDLKFTCNGITANTSSEKIYTVSANVNGYTDASVLTKKTRISYDLTENPKAEIEVYTIPVSGGGGSSSSSKTVVISFETGIAGVTMSNISGKNKTEVDFDSLKVPEVEGKEFEGFFADAEFTKPVTGKQTYNTNTKIYLKWKDLGTPSQPIFTDNHIAYIIGYPEGVVRPDDNISREEVTTVFYRLLRAEKQIEIATTENRFSDVDEDRWSNKAISSMSKGGYISGYESGTFKPEQFITRAEFVTIIANMYKLDKTPATAFNDVTNGYWASEYIGAVSEKGWVNGYEDGTFRPENYVTRAEVMATVNRMLDRKVSAEGISADAKIWSDISADDWYYLDVIEATNAHEYTKADGAETWTKVVDNNVWAEKSTFEDAE